MSFLNHNLVKILLYLFVRIRLILGGLNNLHMHDGVSIHDIVNGDVFFEIIDPQELEFTYRLRPAKDFGAPFNASFSLVKAQLMPVDPPYACDILKNHDDLLGKVALVERGECSFVSKALNIEKAGARAIIITDTQSHLEDHAEKEFYIEMIDDNTDREVNIPAGFLVGHSGRIIRNTLHRLSKPFAVINLPVNVTYRTINDLKQPPWLGW